MKHVCFPESFRLPLRNLFLLAPKTICKKYKLPFYFRIKLVQGYYYLLYRVFQKKLTKKKKKKLIILESNNFGSSCLNNLKYTQHV